MLWHRKIVGGERTEMAEMQALATIPVKTFPIKKRINTELFIDGEVKLYIQKYRQDRIKVIGSR